MKITVETGDVLTERFTDGNDFNDADKWNHNDSKTKVLHMQQ